MDREGNYPPPVYDPEVVTQAILHAATHPVRELFAGGGGWMMRTLGRLAPRRTEHLMERHMFKQQQQDAPPDPRDALRSPGAYGGQERGTYPGMVRRRSLLTAAEVHPLATRVAVGAALLAAAAVMRRTRRHTQADATEYLALMRHSPVS
jgi:hypothetical protein